MERSKFTAPMLALEEVVRDAGLEQVLPKNWAQRLVEWQPSADDASSALDAEAAARLLASTRFRPLPKYIDSKTRAAVSQRLPGLISAARRLDAAVYAELPAASSLSDTVALFSASVDFLHQSMALGTSPAATAAWSDACERIEAGVAQLKADTVRAGVRPGLLRSVNGIVALIRTVLWLSSKLSMLVGLLHLMSSTDWAKLVNSSELFGSGLLGETVGIDAAAVVNGYMNNVVRPGSNATLLQDLFGYTRLETAIGGYLPRPIQVPGLVTSLDDYISTQLSFALGDIARVHGAPGFALFWIASKALQWLGGYVVDALSRIETIEYRPEPAVDRERPGDSSRSRSPARRTPPTADPTDSDERSVVPED